MTSGPVTSGPVASGPVASGPVTSVCALVDRARLVAISCRRRAGARDSGRAIVEFLALGMLLLVPVTYLVVTLSHVQAAAFAVSIASREAGRAFTTANDDSSGYARAQAAAQISFEDFGLASAGTIALRCDGSPCLRPQGRVEALASVTVPLPLLPDVVRGALPAAVPVSAVHVATVDRFRAR